MSEVNNNNEQSTPKTRQEIESHIIAQAWKDEDYKQRLLNNPKEIFEQEFRVELPSEMSVQVMEEDSKNLYFVLPMRPDLSGVELSDEQLEAIAGGLTPTGAPLAAFTWGAAGAALTLMGNWYASR